MSWCFRACYIPWNIWTSSAENTKGINTLYFFNYETPSTHFFPNDLNVSDFSIAHGACLEKSLYTDENMQGFYIDVQTLFRIFTNIKVIVTQSCNDSTFIISRYGWTSSGGSTLNAALTKAWFTNLVRVDVFTVRFVFIVCSCGWRFSRNLPLVNVVEESNVWENEV